MAGDWIKFEHATLDKPEIAIAAEWLDISPGEAIALFLRYWVWLDQNLAADGTVRFVSRKSLEQMLHCVGFAAMLEKIGWASFDDRKEMLSVNNWERHNGNTAKSRALEQKRKSIQRASRPVSVPSPTVLEKRREDLKIKSTVGANCTVDSKPIAKVKSADISAAVKTETPKPKPLTREQQIAAARASVAKTRPDQPAAKAPPEPANPALDGPTLKPGELPPWLTKLPTGASRLELQTAVKPIPSRANGQNMPANALKTAYRLTTDADVIGACAALGIPTGGRTFGQLRQLAEKAMGRPRNDRPE